MDFELRHGVAQLSAAAALVVREEVAHDERRLHPTHACDNLRVSRDTMRSTPLLLTLDYPI